MKNRNTHNMRILTEFWKILLVGLIGIGIVACTGARSTNRDLPTGEAARAVDRSLDTDEPCQLPCWYDLTPGVSTGNEALQTLKHLVFVDDTSIQKQGNEIRWGSSLTDWGGGSIRLNSEDRIEFMTFALEYSLTLQELIERKGTPDGYFALYDEPSGEVSIELLWPQSGLSAFTTSGIRPSEFTKTSPLNPNSLINSVTYFEPVIDAKEYASKLGAEWWIKDNHYYAWAKHSPLLTQAP